MAVCFIKINDNMQMAFIKLHSVCVALHLRTSYTKPSQHQAGTVELLVSSYTDPQKKEQKSMKLSVCFDSLQHVVYLNKMEIYIMYNWTP